MTINYPTSLDTLTNPTGTDSVVAVNHAEQHADANDAIEALQTKVGIDSSADTNSLDYKVAQTETTTQLNARDTENRDRANHTGTQDHTTISDYDTELAGKTNTTPFTPSADYHVATKKYVDDNAGGGGGAVDSVNGQTGVVVLDADDIDDTSTTNKFTTDAEATKLAGIETGATADQTGAEIKAAYEAEANTNAFTDAEQTKLGTVETNADVTDTANVEAAGALMDSELTSITDVKALDQSVISGASPVFATTNMTEGTNKNFVSDAEATVIGNTSGTNSGDVSSVTWTPTTNALSVTDGGSTKQDFIDEFSNLILQGTTLSSVMDVVNIDYEFANGKVVALGNLGASEAIDWSNGTHFTGTLDSNVTVTHSNEVSGQSITLYLSYSGAQRTITWSDVDIWLNPDDSAPTTPSVSGERLVVTLARIGTEVYGSATANYTL